jgi:hypothetical protein
MSRSAPPTVARTAPGAGIWSGDLPMPSRGQPTTVRPTRAPDPVRRAPRSAQIGVDPGAPSPTRAPDPVRRVPPGAQIWFDPGVRARRRAPTVASRASALLVPGAVFIALLAVPSLFLLRVLSGPTVDSPPLEALAEGCADGAIPDCHRLADALSIPGTGPADRQLRLISWALGAACGRGDERACERLRALPDPAAR